VTSTSFYSGILESTAVIRAIFSDFGNLRLDSLVLLTHTSSRNAIIPITANAVAISAQELPTFEASPAHYFKDD
jgi:hypothetical protein